MTNDSQPLSWFFEDSAVILLRARPLNVGPYVAFTSLRWDLPPPRTPGLGYEVFLVEKKRRHLTDPDWPDEPEPRGELTAGWDRGG